MDLYIIQKTLYIVNLAFAKIDIIYVYCKYIILFLFVISKKREYTIKKPYLIAKCIFSFKLLFS